MMLCTKLKSSLSQGALTQHSHPLRQMLTAVTLISRVFNASSTKISQPLGTILSASVSSIVDLFRALAPVAQAEMMALSPALRIRFANDCAYLAADVEQLASSAKDIDNSLAAKLLDASERLATVGEQWFDDCLVCICMTS